MVLSVKDLLNSYWMQFNSELFLRRLPLIFFGINLSPRLFSLPCVCARADFLNRPNDSVQFRLISNYFDKVFPFAAPDSANFAITRLHDYLSGNPLTIPTADKGKKCEFPTCLLSSELFSLKAIRFANSNANRGLKKCRWIDESFYL